MGELYRRLKEYGESDYYPYHMPGHKRQPLGDLSAALAGLDITEIEGFDNLHQAQGILRELQQEAARAYGAEESFFLVNGSTCGVLAAISAALPQEGHLLMARNSHMSAYHGAYLRRLKLSYLFPAFMGSYDIPEAVTPCQVEEALEQEPGIQAVFLVSPTYEGRLADVGGIARVAHKRGIPLIVDEAHGAHLGFAAGFAENSCRQGADIVIHSVHKTLPALTQTALLHVNGSLIQRDLLRRFLHIYQSTSPSYLLMASIDNALAFVQEQGEAVFAGFRQRFETLLVHLKACRYLDFVSLEDGCQDIGKLVISCKNTGLSGRQIYDMLLERYHLQLEMAAHSYCLAMFTLADGPEAYERLEKALLEIDRRIGESRERKDAAAEQTLSRDRAAAGEAALAGSRAAAGEAAFAGSGAVASEAALAGSRAAAGEAAFAGSEAAASEAAHAGSEAAASGAILSRHSMAGSTPIPLWQAWDMEREQIPLEAAAGRIAGDFIGLYPPGVPILVPGERITAAQCRELLCYLEQGLSVQGVKKAAPHILSVLKGEPSAHSGRHE